MENRVSRFFHVYILCFMELQRQVKTAEPWSGGALELKCPGFEAVMKHQVWNSLPRFCRVEGTEGKLLWGKSYAPFMNPSLIDGQKRIFWRENFNKLFYHTYPTSQTGIHSKAYNKQHLHQEVAIQIYSCLEQTYGLFYKFLYCQTYPSTYVWVYLGDCTVVLQMFLSRSTAKVVTETKGFHNLKRSEKECHCMSILLFLVNISMQKWKRIIFQRQKENLTEI